MIAVRLFTPATPDTFLGIAAIYDWNGEQGLRIARVLAHSSHQAADRLEEEIYAEYGVNRAEMHQQIADEGYADEVPVTITGIEVYTDGELHQLDILATAGALAAQGRRTP